MKLRERRRGPRIPVGFYVHQLVDDEPHRCFTTSLSRGGLYMERLGSARQQPATTGLAAAGARRLASRQRRPQRVQLELPLPGENETLWATGDVVYDARGGLFQGTAVRFTAMADGHQRRLVEWIQESRRRLDRAWGEVVRAEHGIFIVRPPAHRGPRWRATG